MRTISAVVGLTLGAALLGGCPQEAATDSFSQADLEGLLEAIEEQGLARRGDIDAAIAGGAFATEQELTARTDGLASRDDVDAAIDSRGYMTTDEITQMARTAPPRLSFVVDAGGAITVSPGDSVTLDASSTRAQFGASIDPAALKYAWEQTDLSGVAVALSAADQPQAVFDVPTSPSRTYLLEFRLTVTDDEGIFLIDDALVLVTPDAIALGSAPLVGGSADLFAEEGALRISVSVQDQNGDLIQSGLTAANFEFIDVTLTPAGGAAVPATMTMVDSIDVQPPALNDALAAVVVFDTSGSMTTNDNGGAGRRAGGQALFDLVEAGDAVAVMEFDYSARVLQDFTDSAGALQAAIQSFDDGGGTALWDTGLEALELLATQVTSGGAVVLLTDGEDTSSISSASALISAATAQDAQLFTVGLGASLNFSELQRVANDTGGAFAAANDSAALQAAFQQVGTGAKKGFIGVNGSIKYPVQAPGRYDVAGKVIVTVGARSVITEFSFPAELN